MSCLLEVKGLTKEYKGFRLDNLSFCLEEGCIMGFIGPNGAGKSTTIKAILNQVVRDSGEIRLWGKDNIACEKELKNRLGVVLDEGYFYGHLSIKKMTALIAPFYAGWEDGKYKKYLYDFGLDENKKISDLSKGMRTKYAIALALSHGAELLIMDEPTSGLDPLVRADILDILQQFIQDERRSVFFSTHITSDLDKIADYIVFINDGRLVLSEPKDELLERHALVKGPSELLSPDKKALFVGMRETGYGFEALTRDRNSAKAAFGSASVVLEKPSIEDIMLFYTRGCLKNADPD